MAVMITSVTGLMIAPTKLLLRYAPWVFIRVMADILPPIALRDCCRGAVFMRRLASRLDDDSVLLFWKQTLYRWRKRGIVSYVQIGTIIWYPRTEIDRLVTQGFRPHSA